MSCAWSILNKNIRGKNSEIFTQCIEIRINILIYLLMYRIEPNLHIFLSVDLAHFAGSTIMDNAAKFLRCCNGPDSCSS